MFMTWAQIGAKFASRGKILEPTASVQHSDWVRSWFPKKWRRYYAEDKPKTTTSPINWTQSDLDQAFRLRAQGHTLKSIGGMFGKSPQAVAARLERGPVLNPLRERRPWSQLELDTLVRLRADGRSQRQLVPELGRSRSSIQTRLRSVARPINALPERRAWTDAEVERLKELYADGKSWSEICQSLPDRKINAVKTKFRGLTSWPADNRIKPYMKEEDDLLRHYRKNPSLTISEIAKHVSRSHDSVRDRIKQLECTTRRREWTPEEEQILKSSKQAGMSYNNIAMLLPGRSAIALKNRFAYMHRGGKLRADSIRQYSTACYSAVAAPFCGSST